MAAVIDIQKLYVAYFNRPADFLGLEYWKSQPLADAQRSFAASQEYRDTYAGKSNGEIVNAIYNNLFGHNADPAGYAYWSNALTAGTITVDNMVAAVANGAQGTDLAAFNAKVSAASKFTTALDTAAEVTGYTGAAPNAAAKAWLSTINSAATEATATAGGALDAAVLSVINATSGGTAISLTNNVDKLTGNVFNSQPVYTPGGNDFINSLQDEDVLTGVGANPTLNVTLGSVNDAAEAMVSPVLNNVQTVNVQVTGASVQGINFASATGLNALNVTRVTSNNANIDFEDLDATTTSLSVSNVTRTGDLTFQYREEVLTGTANQLALGVNSARVQSLALTEGTDGGTDAGYFFETVNVTTSGVNDLDAFTIQANGREDVAAGVTADTTKQTINIVANGTASSGSLEVNNFTASGADTVSITANARVDVTTDKDNGPLLKANDGWSTADLENLTITGAANVTLNGVDGQVGDTLSSGAVTRDRGVVVNASTLTGSLKAVVTAVAADEDSTITSGSGADVLVSYGALNADVTTNAGDDQVWIVDAAQTNYSAATSLANFANVGATASISTGDGNDTVKAAALSAASITTATNLTASVQAASVSTGIGNDTVFVGNLESVYQYNRGVLTDDEKDDVRAYVGATLDTGAGDDTIQNVGSVAENATVTTGDGNDTVTMVGVLAADTVTGALTPTTGTTADDEVTLASLNAATKVVDTLGGVVDLGAGNDAITFTRAVTGTIVAEGANLKGGEGTDSLTVKAVDGVVLSAAFSNSTVTDAGFANTALISGFETLNLVAENAISSDTAADLGVTSTDDENTPAGLTADFGRIDTALTTVNLVSEERALLDHSPPVVSISNMLPVLPLRSFWTTIVPLFRQTYLPLRRQV